MRLLEFIRTIVIAVATLEGVTLTATPPNLIVILTDDQDYRDVGFNGCEDIPTPHIASIAENGVPEAEAPELDLQGYTGADLIFESSSLEPGKTYSIEQSSDLRTWEEVDRWIAPVDQSSPPTVKSQLAWDGHETGFYRLAHGGENRSVPDGYELLYRDDFDSFNSAVWSRGLEDDTPDSDKGLIWNRNTGGAHLLNDNYAGYITDEDSYVEEGSLYLRNQERGYIGTDPEGNFEYTSGWVNSTGKLLFNGTQRSVYIELKAQFPIGADVWPAIWLVTDAPHWPPEVDIWEYFGRFFTYRDDVMALRYIYGEWNDKEDNSKEIRPFHATYDASAWHVYGWEWTSESMKWYLDGELIHTLAKGIDIPEADWPDEDFAVVMNNGIMSVNAGAGAVYPNYLKIDYFDIFQEAVSITAY